MGDAGCLLDAPQAAPEPGTWRQQPAAVGIAPGSSEVMDVDVVAARLGQAVTHPSGDLRYATPGFEALRDKRHASSSAYLAISRRRADCVQDGAVLAGRLPGFEGANRRNPPCTSFGWHRSDPLLIPDGSNHRPYPLSLVCRLVPGPRHDAGTG